MFTSHRSSLNLSRRSFLEGAAGLGAAAAIPRALSQTANPPHEPTRLVYIGTYSSPEGPEGSKGHGKGIHIFEMDNATGVLKPRQVFQDSLNPAWLALHPSRKFLYAANEVNNFEGKKSGAVTAYAIGGGGSLLKLNTVSSHGAGPAHMSIHPSGKHAFVANYAGGSFAVIAVKPDGSLGDATDVKDETGTVGAEQAASAPPGSFAISGHDRTHGHMIESDPAGKFVFGADLGLDKIQIWRFDATEGKLRPNNPASVSLPSGDGPRHFVFHPNGRFFYSLQEESSTLNFYLYDAASGTLTQKQTLSSLPPGFVGTNFTSEVRISPDGKFLYAANRLHDSIASFSIATSGTLKFVGEAWTRGDYPRSFTIDPSGNFLLCCAQRSDAVTTFRVNRATGELIFTGQYSQVGTPAIVVFF